METYDYTTAGFDQFMKRRAELIPDQQLMDEAGYKIRQLSGTSINSGRSKSSDNKFVIDWNQAQAIVNDGSRNRVEIGKIPGTNLYGIRIYDSLGNEIFTAAGQLQTEGLADGSVTSVKVDSISADKITTGTLQATTKILVGTSILIGNPDS